MSRVILVFWTRRATAIASLVTVVLVAGLVAAMRHQAVKHVMGSHGTIAIVAIDAGHGGRDPGAIGRTGLREKEITLDVARRLSKLLRAEGIKVCMTRTADVDYCDVNDNGQTTGKRRDLTARLDMVKRSKAHLLVSIHANSFPDPIWYGAQTFYYGDREEDRRLAVAIQNRLVAELGPNHRLAKSGDIFVLRNCDVPAVAVEIGFLSNPREEELLGTPEYRQRLAESMRNGILDYIKGRAVENPDDEGSAGNRHASALLANPLRPGPDEVVLYFAGPANDSDCLVPELRSLGREVRSMTVAQLAKAVFDELAEGPGKGSILEPAFPLNAVARSVEVKRQVAYVDLAADSIEGAVAGSSQETLAIFALVNSMTELPGISAVKLTIDGKDQVTFAGHIMLDEHFGYHPSLVAFSDARR